MKRLTLILAMMAICIPALYAQYEDYQTGTFTAKDGTVIPYRYLTPQGQRDGKTYPLVLFLHGAGERGSDNSLQLKHGGGMFTNPANRAAYPAFVIFPQCPEERSWAYDTLWSRMPQDMPSAPTESNIIRAVKELVDWFVAGEAVDTRRIYVTGISMGGMGTFDIVIRHPDFFAAAVPICGSVYPVRLTSDIKTPFRIFHGDADHTVPVQGSREAYKALREAGVKAEYVEIPGCGHDSWTPSYRRDDFLPWMFSHKKRR